MTRFQFADIELDLDRFEVTRAGRRLSLEPKAVDVLRFFVERPGRLVTRDELLDGVWPGVAVTPNALTRLVAQLRRELGDDAAEARIIETVPTRGYRFIAAVEAMAPADGSSPLPAARRPLAGWALIATGVALVLAAAAWQPRSDAALAVADDALVPVEGESGSIHSATFSPDGRWLALVSDRSGDFEVYLRDLDQPTSQPVTADGMRNLHPTWSPDSRFIAYFSALRHGIWVVPASGGVARQVSPFGSRPAWSPDGQWIAFTSDEFANELAQPGSRIWRVAAAGGDPQPLTEAGVPAGGHGRPMWSPDGRAVYFASARNVAFELWSVRIDDRLLTRRTADSSGLVAHQIMHGPTGAVAIGTAKWPENGAVVMAGVGDTRGPGELQTVLGSLTKPLRSVSVAPGGALVAVVQSEAQGTLWALPVTASGALAGEPRRLVAGNHPAISPDGRRVAYDTFTEVRVVNLDGTADRAVSTDGRTNQYPTWAGDRRIVALRRTALSGFLTDVDIETGTAVERVALPDATAFPTVAPDGDTFLATVGEHNSIVRGSLSKGTVEPWPQFEGYSFPIWSPDGRYLALEKKQDRHMLLALGDVTTGTVTPLSPSEGQHWPGGFSPDGRWLAIASPGPTAIWNIEIVDVQSKARRRVTSHTSPEVLARFPVWSPRGDVIVYALSELEGTLLVGRTRAIAGR